MKRRQQRQTMTPLPTPAVPAVPWPEILNQALQQHQAGLLNVAAALYCDVLRAEPNQPDALHLLGVLALQQGAPEKAIPLIERAIAVRNDNAVYYSNLGVALQALDRIEGARASLERAVTLAPDHVDSLFNLGGTLQCLGEHAEAVRRYEAVVALVPQHVQARLNLGNAHQSLGQHEAAIACYREVLALAGPHAPTLSSLAVALTAVDRADEALPIFEQVAALTPTDPSALLNLAVAQHHSERFEAAVTTYRRVIALQPEHRLAHQSLGRVLQAVHQPTEALDSFEHALALAGDDVAFRVSVLRDRVGLLRNLDRNADALPDLEAARQHAPDDAGVLLDLAQVLRTLGRASEALEPARHAAELAPHDAHAVRLYGCVLRDVGQYDAAQAALKQALDMDPTLVDAMVDLGGLFIEQNKPDTAIAWLERATAARPEDVSAWANLGIALDLRGDPEGAVAAFARARDIEPTPGVRLRHATVLPAIMRSREDILAWRDRWTHEVAQLQASGLQLDDPTRQLGRVNFFLAYHGLNNRALQEQIARLYLDACPSLGWVAPHCRGGDWTPPSQRQNSRIRIGFVSRYLSRHTIGKLMHGIIGHLDRARFEVVVFQFGKADDEARRIAGLADRAVWLDGNLAQLREQVAAAELDVLFYPDIGMSPTTYFLAFSRLAPVQCVTWGHPDTTGIPNVDAYLSSDSLETPGAEDRYSERLVRFSRLSIWYARPVAPPLASSRADLGLPEDATLYVCPQSLFKLHPDFDDVAVEILRRDPRGRLVLLEGASETWSRLTRERLAATAPEVMDRVLMLPALSQDRFFDLLRLADVMLEPFPFGGGNTSYEAFAVGTPIVTLPMPHLRGRVTSAQYRQMGINEPVATTPAEYVEIALSLANDGARRARLSEQILAANGALYEDDAAVREIEAYLERAVAEAREQWL